GQKHGAAGVGDLLPERPVGIEALARLIDVCRRHRVADAQRAGIGLLLARYHAEQGSLAGAVRTDDPDDAAARQRELDAVHQQPLAVCLAQSLGLDDEIAQPRARRNGDLRAGVAPLPRFLFGAQLLVVLDSSLALGVPRPRRHSHPLELAVERPLLRRGFLLLLRKTILLLVEPGRVVAFPRDAVTAVELEDPAGDV